MNINILEVALCLWEAFLESPTSYPELVALREEVGVATLRLELTNEAVLDACHKGWELVSNDGEGYDEPFDWEFCPQFLGRCVTVSNQSVVLRDDWNERLLIMALAHAA
jgi:hypothetical protein